MFVHGLLRAHARTHGVIRAPSTREDWAAKWPVPEIFVGQKMKAKKRMRLLAAAAVGLMVAGALAALVM